ncbi:Aldehyde/histidinol dehydrogenase [Dichomitus squalens]|uniref:aldehyde dehydrogenase (NAD(+)) n=1 Tax=Dichomitus squalens TaxID=114155 RepID=A0A4Q9PDV0_9APHY|nr:Aldehyde/histidinol dehydrogenase [Dichomitus squalens]
MSSRWVSSVQVGSVKRDSHPVLGDTQATPAEVHRALQQSRGIHGQKGRPHTEADPGVTSGQEECLGRPRVLVDWEDPDRGEGKVMLQSGSWCSIVSCDETSSRSILDVPTHLQWLCCLRRTSLWRSTAVTSSSRYKLRGSSLFASFRITDLALSLAAGNATTWKLAPSAPLCSIAVIKIVAEVLKRNGMRGAVAGLVLGWRAVGGYVDGSFDVDVVSSTCSEAVGRGMSKTVQGCFGKVLLELGGNNAAVVMPSADLNIVLPAVLLGPIGTAGQHCTIMTGGAPYSDLASPLSRSCTG